MHTRRAALLALVLTLSASPALASGGWPTMGDLITSSSLGLSVTAAPVGTTVLLTRSASGGKSERTRRREAIARYTRANHADVLGALTLGPRNTYDDPLADLGALAGTTPTRRADAARTMRAHRTTLTPLLRTGRHEAFADALLALITTHTTHETS